MATLLPIIRANIDAKSTVMTESYQHLGQDFGRHASVAHSQDEYVRYTNAVIFPSGKPYIIHTNTVEGYFSVFKRGMKGVYQHCAETPSPLSRGIRLPLFQSGAARHR